MTTTRITRNLDEAMLGGIFAGVAERYNWDPTLLRIVAVLVALATAVVPAVLLYLAAWVLIPRSDTLASTAGDAATTPAAEPPPPPPAPIGDEISEALRETADRLAEAAVVAADAARQAANEIGEIARRPRATTAEEPTPADVPAEAEASEEPTAESDASPAEDASADEPSA